LVERELQGTGDFGALLPVEILEVLLDDLDGYWVRVQELLDLGPVSSAPKSSEQFGWPDSRSIEKRV
jgi:hypothetical protein